jgi:dipeptidyl aminopeptidase/acylaminoacyl peptidase
MIVYIYERLSQGVHTYVVPSERSSYNTSVFTANGYFVLQPDIVFRPRDPGVSATECVTAAVRKVLESGMVDPKRVGLVGHSWGGYEASFIPTRTRLFAAAVAGAPLTNFFSMFGTVHWNQGMPETEHFETGQARMEVPYWVDMEAYVRNSPVMFVHQLQTPMLVFFGDKDGTVDWHQGVELYNYARRAGKLLVMLVYQGENHSAREKPNQIDYSRRVLQWFGHFLKGEEAPTWIARGVTVLERDREVKRTVRPGS